MEYLVVLFGSLVPRRVSDAHEVIMMTPSDQIVSLAIRTSSLNPTERDLLYIFMFSGMLEADLHRQTLFGNPFWAVYYPQNPTHHRDLSVKLQGIRKLERSI
jgi:hypothetical protein